MSIYYFEDLEKLQRFGYAGAFVFGLLAGSSLPLPLPYLVVTFGLGGVFNPLGVGLAAGLGAGVGGTLVYLLGRGQSSLVKGILQGDKPKPVSPRWSNISSKLMKWAATKGSIVVFFMSAMLNPVFAPMAIAMGALRFNAVKFFIWCTLGNLVKGLAISYIGYFGLGTLLNWLQGIFK